LVNSCGCESRSVNGTGSRLARAGPLTWTPPSSSSFFYDSSAVIVRVPDDDIYSAASTYPPITPTHRGSFRTTSFLPPTCGFRFLRRRGAVALTGCRLGRRGLCATLRTGHRISALVHTRIMLTDPPPLLHHQKLHSTSARRGAVNKSGSIATLCQLSATRRLEPPLGIKSCLRP
jgi:hypothetical protein